MKPFFAAVLMFSFNTPVLAQTPDGPVAAAAPPAAPTAPDNVLTGTVTGQSSWNDLSIAIPAFATDADVPTATSAAAKNGFIGQASSQK